MNTNNFNNNNTSSDDQKIYDEWEANVPVTLNPNCSNLFNYNSKRLLNKIRASTLPSGHVTFSYVSLLAKPDGEFKYTPTIFKYKRVICGENPENAHSASLLVIP